MSFVNEVFNNSYGGCDAITSNGRHTYNELVNTIKDNSYYLEEYRKKGIDRAGVIVKDGINFNTISLILSLIENGITPIIINESIKENIKGIIEKDDIKILFYENFKKPSYLKKIDVVINKTPEYLVSVSPYVNVKSEGKLRRLQWYLSFLNSSKEIEECVCKLYDLENGKIKEEIVTKEEIELEKTELETLDYKDKWKITIITSRLSDKSTFLLIVNALLSNMNIVYCNDTEKAITKILKFKSTVIIVDNNMLLELYTNQKFKNIDLSFLKKVIVNVHEDNIQVLDELLKNIGFEGDYLDINNLCTNQKIIQK
ncbi:MAG: hypothetical protein J6B98_00390 [Bacilli bacterium]|nr:hypothetical protein [Bacilli bacterium]